MVQTRSQRAKQQLEASAASKPRGGTAPAPAPAPARRRFLTSADAADAPEIPVEMTALLGVISATSVWTFRRSRGDAVGGVAAMDASLASRGALVPFGALAAARGLIFLFMAWRLYLLVFVRPPFPLEAVYARGSRFAPRKVALFGRQRLVTFTVQAWTAQCAYFGLAALAASAGAAGGGGGWLPLRLTRYLFELCWAVAHLVTVVSSYVLVPVACRAAPPGEADRVPILQPDQLVLHNANVALMHVDALLSGQCLVPSHAGVAVGFAAYYAAFAWCRARYVAGVVPYFFLDYSLPRAVALAFHLGLVAIIVASFLLGVFLTTQLVAADLGVRVAAHAAIVFAASRLRAPAEFRS